LCRAARSLGRLLTEMSEGQRESQGATAEAADRLRKEASTLASRSKGPAFRNRARHSTKKDEKWRAFRSESGFPSLTEARYVPGRWGLLRVADQAYRLGHSQATAFPRRNPPCGDSHHIVRQDVSGRRDSFGALRDPCAYRCRRQVAKCTGLATSSSKKFFQMLWGS
jgi:hypothetical protein